MKTNHTIHSKERGSRSVVSTTLAQAYIEHPLSIHSASIGTSRQAGGKLLKVAAMLCMLFALGVGQMWGTAPTTAGLNFGSAAVTATFEDASVTSTSNNTSSPVTNNSLSGYGPFSVSYLGKNANGVQSIAIVDGSLDNEDPMTSKYFAITTTNNGASVSFAHSGSTTGAFRFKISKASKMTIGLYNGAASGSFAHANAAACLQFDGGSNIKISTGRNGNSDPSPKGWQVVSSSLPSEDVLDIAVVYNTTGDPTTYGGGSIALSANSAHVYINGTAANDGAGNVTNFYIGGNTIANFMLFNNSGATSTTNTAKVDDIYIYSSLPAAAGDAITLDKNNNDASGSTSGSGTIAADATSLTSGFTAPTRTGYSVEGYYTTAVCTTKVATNLGALQPGITVDATTWTNGSSQWKKGGAATFFTKWTPNDYTVTLNDNSGSGGSGSKTVTFNANTNMTTAVAIPTRTHYIFGGYWTSANSGATLDTKVIDSDGTWVASVSGYTDATPNWINAGDVTLYAKWTEHTYTNYRTVCCTKMGTINNSLTLTQGGNSVTISGWTYNDASSTKPAESNLASYTVRMYKKNGASWDLVSGTKANGTAGTEGTRTGIATNSKSVTFTGLEVESEYKFTIEGIGAAGYCDIEETAITSINSTDVSSTPFKFRYSIYIDNGSNSGWAHHYIEPTGNTDEGSVEITLAGPINYYQFIIKGTLTGDWGQTGTSNIPADTKWTLNGGSNVRLQTWIGGTYTFTVDYSGTTNPGVTVAFPPANQDAGNIVYWDASVVANWDHLHFRVGTDGDANAGSDCKTNVQKVPGTDNFYKVTTASFTGMRVWAIANNTGWTGSNTNGVYKTNTGDGYAVTLSSEYQDYVVDEGGVTLIPYGSGTMGSYSHDNNCRFYTVTKTDGMLTHNVSLNSPDHGTLLVTYTNTSGTAGQTVTEGNNADLAHRCILTITATPDAGYQLSSLTVDGNAFTSGDTIRLRSDIVIAATFTAQTSTVTLDNNNATSGSQQTVTATYDAAMPLTTTASAAVAAISRTGYTFNGWWDNTNLYYTYNSGTGVIASARTWDKTGAQTLSAKWTVNQYTLTWDLQGGTVATAGTGAAVDATGTPISNQDYGTALTVPVVTKTGYNFNVWTPSVAGSMPAENTTYTASWTAQVYNITYKDQGDNAYSGTATDGVPTGAPTTHTYGATTALVNGVKAGYRFDGWFTDVSCTVSAGSSIGATAKTADFTLYAKWTQVYTVTWSVNDDPWETGIVEGNTHVPSGGKVSALPTAPTSSDCDDAKVFVGWRATAIDGTSVSEPSGIFTTVGGSPVISKDTTFYAVFADRSGGDNTLVTSVSELTNGTQVYIYAEFVDSETTYGAVAKAFASGNNNVKATSGSISSNKLTPGENAGLYTIGVTTISEVKYYTFNDGTSYLRATGTSNNYLTGATELGDDEKGLFSITISSNVCSIACKNTEVRGVLQFNKNGDTGDYTKALFNCYASEDNTNRSNVKLFKKNPYVYSNYVTTCASCDADATFSGAPVVSDNMCDGANVTLSGGLATIGAEGCNVSEYGFVWGTASDVTLATKTGSAALGSLIAAGTGFSHTITGLTKGTQYYVRAYATNGHGTAYSSAQSFYTLNVSSIAITTAPTKTNYIVGETFDATGMVVTATLASSATEDVTNDVTYSTSALTAGANQDFAINYTLCETNVSVNQKINVYTLTVSEGDNSSYGTYSVDGALITVTPEAQKTFTLVPTNCGIQDNGNGTYTVINLTGNATVVINYREAAQVNVSYYVGGDEVTGLRQTVYESSQITLPTASALSSAMASQIMALPDELYPNFIGWSETEFSAQTADPTIVTSATINATKSFYAVYSNVNKKQILPSDFSGTKAVNEGDKTIDGITYNIHEMCKQSNKIQFGRNSYLYSKTALSYIKKIEIATLDLPVYVCSDNSGTIDGSAITPIGSGPYTYSFPANKQYFKITDKSGTSQVDYIYIFYSSSTVYYMTQFCTRYDITGASTSGTAVDVNGNTGGTLTSSHNALCEGKSLTLSATVNAQYSFGEWKIVETGSNPEVDLTTSLLGANKTSLTPPAFTMPAKNITVSATITEKTATAWSWTYNSAAIPNPLILYVGEIKQLDVTYTPDAAQLVSAQKNYSVTKESSPVAEHAKAMNYYKMRGAAGVTEVTNATVTFSLNSLSQEVNVTVKPLPSASFEDNVHNAISTTVTATVTDGVVALTQKTPAHADISPVPANGNDCEKEHLHLVGWIDGEWEPYINYINGGSRPSDSDIITATGYFYLPNADIDLSAKDGHTYYAIWGKVDE